MKTGTLLLIAVLLATTLGAGCMGPEEDPATTPEETETTPGDTVEGGAAPTEVTQTPTMFETTDGEENATDDAGGDGTTEEGESE